MISMYQGAASSPRMWQGPRKRMPKHPMRDRYLAWDVRREDAGPRRKIQRGTFLWHNQTIGVYLCAMNRKNTDTFLTKADRATCQGRINDKPDCVSYRACLNKAALSKSRSSCVCPLSCPNYVPIPSVFEECLHSSGGTLRDWA